MVRTDEQYYADIRTVLQKFYQAGDMLYLVRFFKQPRKCQMCGDKVDIWNCYELRNERSGETIICGCNCIVKYATVLRLMDQTPMVLFPERLREHAEKINRKLPGTVVIKPGDEPYPSDPDEDRGWDLCDCGVPLSYCDKCDNEVCPECDRGCTCGIDEVVDVECWDEEGKEKRT
jgi:hypothetical protein